VTPEKAFEVQKRWKTPLAFIEAFERMDEKGGGGKEGQKEQMKMVSDEMSNLFGRKKIAKTLSVKISRVWGSVEE
jgi:crossover junction endonuclease MUS81